MNDITALAQRMKQQATLANGFLYVETSNVFALVEALEKAQAQSSKWLEAYHKAVSVGARYEERIAELESRTVTVKLRDINEYLADVHDKTLALTFRRLAEGVRAGDIAAMTAAGIQVIEGEG